MIKVREENIVFLTVSSFVGMSVGAMHYYGRLEHLQGGDSSDVTHKLTQIEADRFNKGWLTKEMRTPDVGYQKGEKLTRFSSRRKVINAAKRQFKIHFSKAAVLVLGRSACFEPQEILVGPKEFKDKINVLAKEYGKLDWDIETDRPEIKKIEEKWQKLWPRKYRCM